MFGKDKESKEFFEVFKRPQELDETKYNSKIVRKEQVNPTVLPRSDKKESKEKAVVSPDQLGWIKDTKGEEEPLPDDHGMERFQSGPGKVRKFFLNEVVLKQETLIFGALGAVFLSLACFFVGYRVGNKSALDPEIIQEYHAKPVISEEVKTIPRGREIGTVDLSIKEPLKRPDEQVENTRWTLRIISYSNTNLHMKQAANLAKAIKNMTGLNTFVAKRGNELVVCAGKFNSKDGAELKKALKEISILEYEGKRQFTSSYPIQIK